MLNLWQHLNPGHCSSLRQFTEMVLRLLDTGAEAVEEVDGIDAMEAVQVRLGACQLYFMVSQGA
jgi:hypothetical protein